MSRTKRRPGDRTARDFAEDFACLLVPTIHVFDCGRFQSLIRLTGPLAPLALALAAERDGVSLYQAAYRELRKRESHLIAHKAAQAIAEPEKAWAGFGTSKTTIERRRAAEGRLRPPC